MPFFCSGLSFWAQWSCCCCCCWCCCVFFAFALHLNAWPQHSLHRSIALCKMNTSLFELLLRTCNIFLVNSPTSQSPLTSASRFVCVDIYDNLRELVKFSPFRLRCISKPSIFIFFLNCSTISSTQAIISISDWWLSIDHLTLLRWQRNFLEFK